MRIEHIGRFLKSMAIVIIVASLLFGMVFGYFAQEITKQLTSLLPATVFLMIFPVMLTISPDAILQLSGDLKLILIIMLLNFLLAPIFARGLAGVFFPNQPDFAAGLILFSLLPAVNGLPSYVYSAEANVPLSIAVLSISQLFSVIALPLGMWVLAGSFVYVSPVMLMKGVFQIVLFPLVLGMLTRFGVNKRYGEPGVRFLESGIAPFSIMGLSMTVFIIASLSLFEVLDASKYMSTVVFAVLLLYASLLLFGIVLARVFHYRYAEGLVLLLAAAGKNSTIGVALATLYFGPLAVVLLVLAFLVQLPLNVLFALGLKPQLQSLLGTASLERAK